MTIDFTDLNLKEKNVKNMVVIDSCHYDGLVELREKANKFYICCVWESNNSFTICRRFTCLKEAKKDFTKWKKKIV